MKMSKILSLVLALVMVLSCFAGCGLFGEKHTHNFVDGKCECGETDPNYKPEGPVVNPLAGTYNIKMWVSEKEEGENSVVKQMQAQINDFMAANPGIVIVAEISGVTEADAGSQVVADVSTAPDIFCFAQDQLARLVQAAALAKPGGDIEAQIKANNDAGSLAAATVGGQLYAYPMTSDNGYYLYYDKSVVTDPTSLEAIIADCEAAFDAKGDHRLFRYALENGWYTASFFFGAGCHSNWTMDAAGNFNGIDDDFNSAQGLVAMKAMQKLAHSRAYDPDADQFSNAAAIVTGIWNAGAAEAHFGENLGVCKLPSFTVDGKTYQLGSFSGNKLMGVKPQTDAKKGAVLQLLAHYLTSEKCQLERFEMWQWGPSNLNAQASEAVQANASLAALAAQNAHAVPQGQIHGSWWDFAKALGAGAKSANTDEELQGFLDTYDASIDGILNMSDDEKMKWSMIGYGGDWNTDYALVQVSEGVWETEESYTFAEGDTFKLRRGASWDVQVGKGGQMKTPTVEPANIEVTEAGTFVIRLEWDGVSEIATITFLPAE